MCFKKSTLIGLLIMMLCFSVDAAETIQLMSPDRVGGKPLMQALNDRRSMRSFDERALPIQILSNLLWAASGVNREDGKRTAPTAGNGQEIDIYAAMKGGLYLYDPNANVLNLVLEEDIRALTGRQDFTKKAPVNLIFVSDFDRIRYEGFKEFYSATDTGFISQNVYLFCASEGLATVVLGWVDKEVLAQKMGLSESQKVILTQPVGYPKE